MLFGAVNKIYEDTNTKACQLLKFIGFLCQKLLIHVNVYLVFHIILDNSLKIHEENTKKITAVSVVLYVITFHVNLHKL